MQTLHLVAIIIYNLPLINEAVFYSLERYEQMCMQLYVRGGTEKGVTTLEAK